MLLRSALFTIVGHLVLATPNGASLIDRRANTITIKLDHNYQKVDGFGFSQAFGTAYTISNLASAPQKQALDLLFSKTVGAGMTILRNRIGSGGSGDSIEPNAPSSSTASPTFVWDGSDSDQVWLSKQAKNYGVSTFYADAWSAPGYMKTNGQEINGGYICGVSGETCSSGDWKQAYANFLVQYIKDYQSEGIQITHVGFLNEPEIATSYSSMQSSGTQAADFIKVLHPTLQQAGLGSVGITCCDAEGWDTQKTMTAQLVSAGVENMISRITSHSYTSNPTSPINTTRPTWQSEYAKLGGQFSTVWYSTGDLSEGMAWANLIYTGLVDAHLSAYLHWYGVESNGDAGCLISTDGTTVSPSAKLWAFAQWSRFVRPGATRVATSGSISNMLTSAFKNTDGTVAVQFLNNGASSQTTVLKTTGGSGFKAKSVKSYITNNSNLNVNAYSASISGGAVSATIPGYSMVTFVLTG